MTSFAFTYYRSTPSGLQECKVELDSRLVVLSETNRVVEAPTAHELHQAFSKVLLSGTNILLQGVRDEQEQQRAKLTQKVGSGEGPGAFTPTKEAITAMQILTQESDPCETEACRKIRKACQDEIMAAAGEGGCDNCARGAILRKYQMKLVSAGISK